MKYSLYLVGGTVRDSLLGIKSNDRDYSVVLENYSNWSLEEGYKWFVNQLKIDGFDIKVEHPKMLTVRAMFPEGHRYSGVADFVIARKELYYREGSRNPVCDLGTLRDDLERRDFTVNSLAVGKDGLLVDLFGGSKDLSEGILRTPLDPYKTFKDDPLRIIRGMRFCITKSFVFSKEVRKAIIEIGIHGIEKVSVERVQNELNKCFKHNTLKTLKYLQYMKKELNFDVAEYAFKDTGLWLETTNKK